MENVSEAKPRSTMLYLDHKFIEVDGRFIPIVFCADTTNEGKVIVSRLWGVIRPLYADYFLYTKEELIETFKKPYYKVPKRNSLMGYHEDFSQWLISAIDEAVSIKELLNRGYRPLLRVFLNDVEEPTAMYFSSNAELDYLLNEYAYEIYDIGLDSEI